MSFRLVLLASFSLAVAAPALADTLPFAGSAGSTTPFGAGGVSFASGAGDFVVGPNAYSFGYGLNDIAGTLDSSFNIVGDALTVTLPYSVSAVTFAYGIDNDLGGPVTAGDTLTLTPNRGTAATFTPAIVGGLFPEGTATFASMGSFSSFTLTSANEYSIGDLTFVPEPATVAVLGLALGGLAFARRRG